MDTDMFLVVVNAQKQPSCFSESDFESYNVPGPKFIVGRLFSHAAAQFVAETIGATLMWEVWTAGRLGHMIPSFQLPDSSERRLICSNTLPPGAQKKGEFSSYGLALLELINFYEAKRGLKRG